MFNVFEQPWTLLIVAIVTSLVSMVIRGMLPEKRHGWQLALPVFLAVAAFGLDFLVETDREKINAVIGAGVKAVEEENPDAIETLLSDNYRDSYHLTKRALMSHCRTRLSGLLVEKNIKRIVSMEISPSTATVIFTVRILFDKRSHIYQSFKSQMFTKVKLELEKEQDNWLISQVEILEIDRYPANWRNIK